MGENGIIILTIIASFVLLGAATALLFRERKRKKERAGNYVEKKDGGRDYLRFVQKLYRSIPILDRYYAKTRARVKILYPADNYSINKETSRILAKGTLIWTVIFILVLISSGLDVFYFCFGVIMDTVIITAYVDKRLDIEELSILSQMDMLITKIRHYYENKNDPVYAIEMSLLDVPRMIGLHAQNIYDIITSPKMKMEIDKYAGNEPNQYVMMLLQICASVKEKGDKKLPDGRTIFTSNLDSLKMDVGAARLNKEKNIDNFRYLTALTIVPLFAIKPVEWWANKYIPEISPFYQSMGGKVCMAMAFLITLVVYTIVVTLRDQYREVKKENNLIARAAQVEPVSTFLDKYITLNYTKYRRYNEYKNGIGDHTGPKALLFMQVLISVLSFFTVMAVIIGGCITQSYSYIHDWEDAYVNDVTSGSDEYKENLRKASEILAKEHKGKEVTSEELINELYDSGMVVRQTDATMVANNVIERIDKQKNAYFKWWYLLIASATAIVGFQVPVWILEFKKQVIEMRQREEIIQFQSLMMILVYIPGTGVSEIMDWMERFSSVFKMEIARCRVDINSNQKRALKSLKNDTDYEPLRDFVDNLMAIDKVGVSAAFAEINGDRTYFQMERDRINEQNRDKRAKKANGIALVPLFSAIILYLLVPLLLYAFDMLTNLSGTLDVF